MFILLALLFVGVVGGDICKLALVLFVVLHYSAGGSYHFLEVHFTSIHVCW
ncbi:hypothetical protein C2G38_2203788 [Gigaspora rosea]|uniref:Uncharacterized protein n=1 Tax=Gigaspora rosea TaxID=44941 RepID=A0A397UM12_9GLOM|nr:hypothetical protein C2G38_2203788 [Gigaspora rosea]